LTFPQIEGEEDMQGSQKGINIRIEENGGVGAMSRRVKKVLEKFWRGLYGYFLCNFPDPPPYTHQKK
jgi:hypothetical protein